MRVLAAERGHAGTWSIQVMGGDRGDGFAASSGGRHSKARAEEMVRRQTRYEPRFGGTR